MIAAVGESKHVECAMCNTQFVAILLGAGETDENVRASTALPVVEAEPDLEGAVTCPNPDCAEVFLVPEFRGSPRLRSNGLESPFPE